MLRFRSCLEVRSAPRALASPAALGSRLQRLSACRSASLRPQAMWILRSTNEETERLLRVTPGSIRTVGRGPRADFVIDAALLSRVHCRLVATQTELSVEDLASTNGTFVNDRRVAQSTLQTGDRLRLGRLEFDVSEE